jgi:hypothetical protein
MAVSEEQAKALWADFDGASRKLKQQLTMKSGGSGAESAYSETYQALVSAGLVAQLRGKHR